MAPRANRKGFFYLPGRVVSGNAEVTHAFAKHRGSIEKREQAGPLKEDIGSNSEVRHD
jgi:hypothetical protein